jgi:hypothetical protein
MLHLYDESLISARKNPFRKPLASTLYIGVYLRAKSVF